MKRLVYCSFTFLLFVTPAAVFAKAATSKITINGTDLKTPIEITDPKTLANFIVWTGPGTSCSGVGCPDASAKQAESFIVDWSQAVAEPPRGLQRYEVSFYAKMPDERLVYVVFYEYDPAANQGYIYLPVKSEEWYRLDTGSIVRGLEGEWFRASSAWERVARPLLAGAARPAQSRIGDRFEMEHAAALKITTRSIYLFKFQKLSDHPQDAPVSSARLSESNPGIRDGFNPSSVRRFQGGVQPWSPSNRCFPRTSCPMASVTSGTRGLCGCTSSPIS